MVLAKLIRRRRGFTLIELLVVISIIGILAALALTGAFRAREGQDKANTSNTMQKIASLLDQQLKTVVDQASRTQNGPAYNTTLQLAGMDTRRAKALWIKINLRKEFPTSAAELSGNPFPDPPSIFNSARNQTFATKTAALNQIIADDASLATFQWKKEDVESAVLLYISINSARSGVMVDLDQTVGSTGIQSIVSDAGKSFKVFVDSWGSPIKLVRFNTNNALWTELDSSKFAGTTAKSFDPTDREGTLRTNWQPVTNSPALAQLWAYLYPGQSAIPPDHNYQPFIVSAGPDKAFGTDDDLYSFRMREVGQRGD